MFPDTDRVRRVPVRQSVDSVGWRIGGDGRGEAVLRIGQHREEFVGRFGDLVNRQEAIDDWRGHVRERVEYLLAADAVTAGNVQAACEFVHSGAGYEWPLWQAAKLRFRSRRPGGA